MRESLTILAIALILVLTTALVGPYLVDWNAHRAAIEQRLSQLLGAKVTVAGPIDVKLLPRPIFRLADITVASASPRAPAAAAERLDVELALTALLRGEFVFVEADLAAPKLTLVMDGAGAVVLPRFAATDPDHVSLSHVSLRDGSILVVDEDGRPVLTVAGLSGDGDADSLLGPFRFDGTADSPRGTLAFRVSTGAIDSGRLRVKGTLDAAAGLPRVEGEGILTLIEQAKGAARPRFEGSLAAQGLLPLADSAAAIPWSVGGKLHAEASAVDVTALELRAGADGRALIMAGAGRIEGGADPKASVTLRARQADLSRLAVLSGSGDEGKSAGAKAPALLAGLRALAENPDLFAFLPLPVTAELGIDALSLGQLTLGDFAAKLTAARDAPLTGMLSVDAPDGSRVALDGVFEPGPAAVFKGHADASTSDLGRLADSLAADLPDQAQLLRGALPARKLAFSGVADLSGVGFAAHDADLTLDRSRFAGTITLTRAVGADRARLFADLTSDALDLDALPDWRDTAASAGGLDLSISLAARAVRLTQSDTGGVAVGQVALQLAKTGAAVTLDRLSLADIGGATADLSGRSDGKTAHLEGRVDARRLKDLLTLVQRLAPSPAGVQLLARADALSPALLTVAADATLDDAARPSLDRAAVEGTVAGTTLSFQLDRTDAGVHQATLGLDAPEGGALLRQLGIATLPSTAIGRSRLDADARLDASFHPVAGGLTAHLADTVLALRGQDGGSGLTGHATLQGRDVAPLLRAVTLASPEAGTAWPVDLSADVTVLQGRASLSHLAGRAVGTGLKGDLAYVTPVAMATLPDANTSATPSPALTGRLAVERLPLPALAGLALGPLPSALMPWPDTPFAPSVVTSLPRSAVALEVGTMALTGALEARDAKVDVRLAPGLVTLSGLSARLGDGRIAGTVDLRRDGKSASLSGHAEWSGLSPASPAFGGRSRGTLDVAGSGTSLAALVAGLAGSGTVSLDDARLPHLDGTALARTVTASGNAGSGSLDSDAIRQDVTDALDKGALALGAVSSPMTLAAGTLRADPVTIEAAGLRATSVASLDLRSLKLDLTTTVSLPKPPKDWVGGPPAVTVAWSGPFAAPARTVDATALVNGIAARAIARDQARIEAFQDDVRERAFFARRLRAIEAEQQAVRDKAKADQEAQMQKLLQSLPLAPLAVPRAPARPGAGKAPLELTPKALQPTP